MSENTNVNGELSPEVELQMEIEADPTIEMEMQVEIGSRASELNAEAWAVGQRGGVDVSSTDQTYHNNAKYYAEQAQAIVAGDIVDDDAGIGDLLKVWSADKDVKELDKKAPVIDEPIPTEAAVQEFSDGADGMPMKIVVGIEPVQDLHGYDNPWIGGEGKNLINAPDVTLAEAGDVFNGACKLAAGTYTLSSSNTSVSVSVAGVSGTMPLTFTLADAVTTLQITASGAGTFNNIQIESSSSATDFAPYENICPISGWTGCKVTRTGKNLLGGTALRDALLTAIPSASHDATNKVVYFTASSASAKKIVSREYKEGYAIRLPFKENTQYSFIFTGYNTNTTTGTTNINIYYTDGTSDNPWFNSTAAEKSTRVFVSDAGKTIAYITGAYNKGASYFYYEECGIFEGVLTAADFEPYQGNTYNIAFPAGAGTVYGGTLIVNKDGSGSLLVRDYYIKIDQNTSNLTFNSDTGQLRKTGLPYSMYNSLYHLCDQYTPYNGSFSNLPNKRFMASSYSLAIKDTNYTSLQEWQTHLEEIGGIEFCLRILTSYMPSYSLTPGQVKSLLGYNALWADTGNINSVEYCADTKLYVEKRISASERLLELIITANREDGMTATQAYDEGDLLIVNGTLYKASTSIANGATLTVGTNVTATTVAAELAAMA